MKKIAIPIVLIILIIIAVPLINSKDSAVPRDINFDDSKEIQKHIVNTGANGMRFSTVENCIGWHQAEIMNLLIKPC